MRRLMLGLGIAALAGISVAAAQNGATSSKPSDYAADVESIDAAIATLYDVISGPPGPRDWDRFRHLFAEGGRLTSTGFDREGEFRMRQMTCEDYIEGSGSWLETNGFFETEIARKLERFGPIAQAFSTYETRREKGGEPMGRGINSIQLVNDGSGWRILSIFWANEGADHPIPEHYLP